MMSSGVGAGRGALLMLLVSLGAAVEVFNAGAPSPALGQDPWDLEMGPEKTFEFHTGAGVFRPEEFQPNINPSDLMLPRLLEGFIRDQELNVIPRIRFRTNGQSGVMDPRFLSDPKEVSKRLPSALRSQPQQKWKIKKGKALNAQIVCYFKLCAFRSPH